MGDRCAQALTALVHAVSSRAAATSIASSNGLVEGKRLPASIDTLPSVEVVVEEVHAKTVALSAVVSAVEVLVHCHFVALQVGRFLEMVHDAQQRVRRCARPTVQCKPCQQ